MPWTHAALKEIDAALHSPDLQEGDTNRSFITEDQIHSIWDRLLSTDFSEPGMPNDNDVPMPRDINTRGKELLKIVSILVLIHWDHWSDFQSIFFLTGGLPRLERTDAELPFTYEVLKQPDFLGGYATLFRDNQFAFLPIIIEEGHDQVYTQNYRLPIVSESKDVETGSYGEVTQVSVAKGCFSRDRIPNGTVKADLMLHC